jgi:NAD-dependent deacetylase
MSDPADPVATLADWIGAARHSSALPARASRPRAACPISAPPAARGCSNKPIPFDVFLASEEARREAWRRKFAHG